MVQTVKKESAYNAGDPGLILSTTNWHLPRALPTTKQQRHLPSASLETRSGEGRQGYSFKRQVSREKGLLGNSSDWENLLLRISSTQSLGYQSILIFLRWEELSLGVFKDIESENRSGRGSMM